MAQTTQDHVVWACFHRRLGPALVKRVFYSKQHINKKLKHEKKLRHIPRAQMCHLGTGDGGGDVDAAAADGGGGVDAAGTAEVGGMC